MKTISTALMNHLLGDVRTVATIWKITRTDGAVFGFTDHDQSILFQGLVYDTAIGYTGSAIDATSDMATSNMEINALLNADVIMESDIEGGLWNQAAVTVMLVNFMDLTMGALILNSGRTGQFAINEGSFTAEIRSLSQIMQQPLGEVYSPSCRANLGDSRCTVNLAPYTFNATVDSLIDILNFGASSLTQTGPTVEFVDSQGQMIPTASPFQIQIVPPTGGSFAGDVQVKGKDGTVFSNVGSSGAPGATNQYTCTALGLYTFYGGSTNSNAGQEVFINYNYGIGFFAYGYVKFLTGANAGLASEVRSFSPGAVGLAIPLPNPVALGDTFTIVAGCDRSMGTCKSRFNNLVNFRGEPYVPGTDTILKSQSS